MAVWVPARPLTPVPRIGRRGSGTGGVERHCPCCAVGPAPYVLYAVANVAPTAPMGPSQPVMSMPVPLDIVSAQGVRRRPRDYSPRERALRCADILHSLSSSAPHPHPCKACAFCQGDPV